MAGVKRRPSQIRQLRRRRRWHRGPLPRPGMHAHQPPLDHEPLHPLVGEVGSRRGSYPPFPAPSSQTGHEVLPHPAFPWAVDRLHSPAPPGLATGPSNPRGSSTGRFRLDRCSLHAQLEVLRYGGLCCPRRSSLLLPPPTSARRSTTSRVTLIGFAVTGASEGGTPRICECRCRDGSLLFHDGLYDRSAPTTPTGLWCCASKVFTPFMAFARVSGARHPHVSRWCGVGSRRGYRIPCVRTDHLLAAHGDFVMALRQSGLPSRRPPATGPLGRYPGRTFTGKSIAACQDTPHTHPTAAELRVDTAHAIALLVELEQRPHLRLQRRVVTIPPRRPTLRPRIISLPCHIQHPTHIINRKRLPAWPA